MSKRDRKQLRKELVRRVERRRTLLGRAVLICAVVSVVGLVAALVLSQTGNSVVATWVAGSTGIVIFLMVGFVIARAVTLRRQKRRMSFLGWVGVAFASIAGVQLVTALVLLLAGEGEASELTAALSLIPVLFAVGFFGAEWTKDVRGSDNPVDNLSIIINN